MSSSPEPLSASERLIAELEEEAELVDDGKFTVDLGRAGAKLGMFALADPDAWTALLVEVAALLDATRIDFALEPGSATVVIEPNVLTPRPTSARPSPPSHRDRPKRSMSRKPRRSRTR